jgi:hypothetical protein
VPGTLPPAVIQKRVKANFERFKECYEAGLGRNPTLEGRVTVRFVIARSGNATEVQALGEPGATLTPDPGDEPFFQELGWSPPSPSGQAMPDPEVTACVVDGFKELVFPPPEGGIVTVVYPIYFSPGDDASKDGKPDAK